MGCQFSCDAHRAIEFFNEVLVLLGCGAPGLVLLCKCGMNTHFFRTLSVAALTTVSLAYVLSDSKKHEVSSNRLIFLTGCDSGLGFSLAHHAAEMGLTVVAGFLDLQSEGAALLAEMFGNKIHRLELDVTKDDSVEAAHNRIEAILKSDSNLVFWALVNNAGVMVFGEFEWLTNQLISSQIDVNLVGTMRITKTFCPLLRKHLGRVITVSSHCALATLPGLSVYGATKAGLSAWNDGLRVEMNKYGVDVITFIPGSFIQYSNIMARQNENVYRMQTGMTPEQWQFHGEYFKLYNSYLSSLSGAKSPMKISDPGLYTKFEECLLDVSPNALYIHEPLRYKIYHFLFKISPVKIRDYLVVKFMQMPEWVAPKSRRPFVPEIVA